MDDTGTPAFPPLNLYCNAKVMRRVLLDTGTGKRTERLGPEVGPCIPLSGTYN